MSFEIDQNNFDEDATDGLDILKPDAKIVKKTSGGLNMLGKLTESLDNLKKSKQQLESYIYRDGVYQNGRAGVRELEGELDEVNEAIERMEKLIDNYYTEDMTADDESNEPKEEYQHKNKKDEEDD